MRISDWSSDVCSSDLRDFRQAGAAARRFRFRHADPDGGDRGGAGGLRRGDREAFQSARAAAVDAGIPGALGAGDGRVVGLLFPRAAAGQRSEEHTSELQSLMRISYTVFCLKKKNKKQNIQIN